MQERIRINGVDIKQPDSYQAALATTSTADSKRDMSLVMHNTPIGTVEAYTLKWSNIPVSEAANILQQIIDKPKYTVHYLDIYSGTWKDDEFYSANMNAPVKTVKEGKECWKELSFQITRIKPV